MNSLLQKITASPFFETLKHSKNYLVSNLAVKGLGIISLPVMTRLLLPADYGTLNVFTSYNVILIALLTLNCYSALGRYYYEEQDDFKEFFGTSIIFVFALLFGFFFLFWGFQVRLSLLLDLPQDMVIYLVPMVMFYVASSWYEQVYVPQSKSRQIAVRNIINSYGGFVLSVAIIYSLKENRYMGQVYSLTAMGVLFTCYYIYALRSYIKLSFSMKALKYCLHYSLPLIPYAISVVLLAQIDRVIINKYAGPTDVGLFSLAYNIGALLTLALSSLSQAWTPAYFRLMKEENYPQMTADIALIMKILMVCAYFLILFGQEIGMVLASKNFHSALFIVPIIVVGLVFYSYSTFYSWNVQYAKKNIYMAPIVVTAGITNIVLNLVFVPKYGYVAAAFASSLSYLVMLLMSVFVCKRFLNLYPTPIGQVIQPLLVMIPFIAAFYGLAIFEFNMVLNVFFKLSLLVLFAALTFYKYLMHLHPRFGKLRILQAGNRP